MADWRMKGHYIKNCNCAPSCPCDTYGYPAPYDNFEILASVISTVHGPHFEPITFEFDREARTAVSVPGFFETTSEPLKVPASGDEQRVIVQMPGGFEYREMEVAQTGVLQSSGEVKFDLAGTHSSLAEVDHTPAGLAA